MACSSIRSIGQYNTWQIGKLHPWETPDPVAHNTGKLCMSIYLCITTNPSQLTIIKSAYSSFFSSISEGLKLGKDERRD